MFERVSSALVALVVGIGLAAPVGVCIGDPPTPVDPVDPSEPGQPIPPPGPDGCLCACPGNPTTPAELWFCGDKCAAIAASEGGVLVIGTLTDWLE
jgi:hypothetical protein